MHIITKKITISNLRNPIKLLEEPETIAANILSGLLESHLNICESTFDISQLSFNSELIVNQTYKAVCGLHQQSTEGYKLAMEQIGQVLQELQSVNAMRIDEITQSLLL